MDYFLLQTSLNGARHAAQWKGVEDRRREERGEKKWEEGWGRKERGEKEERGKEESKGGEKMRGGGREREKRGRK